MKMSRIVFAFLLGILFTAIISAVTPQIVFAACHDATGKPIPCPPPRKTPTSVPSTLTPMPTECRLPDGAPCTPTPTACPLAPCTPTPINTTTSGGCALAACTPTPCLLANGAVCTPTSTPASIPVTGGGGGFGPLGWILTILIIVVCFGGGFLFFFRKAGGTADGSDKMGAQPHMDDGSVGNPDLLDGSNQFKKYKMGDGSNQFEKYQPNQGEPSPGNAADHFIKFQPNDGQSGPGEQGGEQL